MTHHYNANGQQHAAQKYVLVSQDELEALTESSKKLRKLQQQQIHPLQLQQQQQIQNNEQLTLAYQNNSTSPSQQNIPNSSNNYSYGYGHVTYNVIPKLFQDDHQSESDEDASNRNKLNQLVKLATKNLKSKAELFVNYLMLHKSQIDFKDLTLIYDYDGSYAKSSHLYDLFRFLVLPDNAITRRMPRPTDFRRFIAQLEAWGGIPLSILPASASRRISRIKRMSTTSQQNSKLNKLRAKSRSTKRSRKVTNEIYNNLF